MPERIRKSYLGSYAHTKFYNLASGKSCTHCWVNNLKAGDLLCATCRYNGVVYRINFLRSGHNIYENDDQFERHLKKREQLMKAHEAGKLSNSFYTVKNGKRYLSPDKLRAEGF